MAKHQHATINKIIRGSSCVVGLGGGGRGAEEEAAEIRLLKGARMPRNGKWQ